MNKLYVLPIIFGSLLLLPFLAFGEEEVPQVIISEINWAGSELSSADEWIELYNTTSESVDIGSWVLTGSATSGNALSIEKGTIIEPGETLLISNYEFEHEKSTLNIVADLVSSSLSLPNSDLNIMLTEEDGTLVDEVEFDSNPPGSTDPRASAERNLSDLSWYTASDSMNIIDDEQFGTPGYVYIEESDDAQVEDEVDTEEIDEEILAICEELYGELDSSDDDVSDEEENDTESDSQDEDTNENEDDSEEDESESTEEETDETSDDADEEVNMSYEFETIIINEVVSNPEEGDEWIEFYNPHQDLSLEGWYVTDATGTATALKGSIDLEGYYVLEDPKGQLNNSGDVVQIYDPNDNLIDTLTYGTDSVPAPDKGESLARVSDNWYITSILTPGEENQLSEEVESEEGETDSGDESTESDDDHGCEPTTTAYTDDMDSEVHQVVSIATKTSNESKDIKVASVDYGTYAKGIVTAGPGLFGDQVMFIEGMQLYSYYSDWPDLEVGDVITASGEKSESRGEERLKLSSSDDIVKTDFQEPTIHLINTIDASSMPSGYLVRIRGDVTEKNGDKLTLTDESGTITIVNHSNTNISFSELLGKEIEVTGLLRQIGEESRIYPRSQSDITELKPVLYEEDIDMASGISDTNQTPWIGIGLATIAIGSLSYWFIKSKLETENKRFMKTKTI